MKVHANVERYRTLLVSILICNQAIPVFFPFAQYRVVTLWDKVLACKQDHPLTDYANVRYRSGNTKLLSSGCPSTSWLGAIHDTNVATVIA